MSLQDIMSHPHLSEPEPFPLSSDEVVSAEDVENLHAIISNSHLEEGEIEEENEEDEQKELENELQRDLQQLEEQFPGIQKEVFEEVDAEYLPYQNRDSNVVASFTLWDIFRKGAINLVLPFINGVMLGFGEILAHEIGFHYGFFGARVQPARRVEERRRQKLL